MKGNRQKNWLFVTLGAAALIIILGLVGVFQPLERILVDSSESSGSWLYNLGSRFRRSYNTRLSQEELAVRLEALQKEVARLTVENSRQKEVTMENDKLRRQLDFLETHDFQAIAAEVVSRESLVEGVEGSQDLIIDKGRSSGIMIGQAVVSEEGLIVGKVVEAKDASAKICLTTSPECKLAAAVQNENRTQGISDGDLGLTIKMEYIPQLEKIAVGDTVITSGLGDRIPRGLLIGKIIEVRSESNEVWQEATIEPLVNLDSLTVVSVIIR